MILKIQLKPNSRVSEVISHNGNVMRLRVKSPPVEGKANKEMIYFLSKYFKVPQSMISIKSGDFAKTKIVEIIE